MHKLTVRLLHGTPSWDKLVRRSCPYNENKNEGVFLDWIEDQAVSQSGPIKWLANILVEMKKPEDSMMELLHVICERYPPIVYTADEANQPMLFHLSCPCKRSHSVSHLGFLLLGVVVLVMSCAAPQQIEKVNIAHLQGSWLACLGFWVSRQQRAVKEVFLPNLTSFLNRF